MIIKKDIIAKLMIVLINLPLVVQRSDVFTTGIVYMPLGLAYLTATLRQHGLTCSVIDAFGQKPWQIRKQNDFFVRGLFPSEILTRISPDSKAILIFASSLAGHSALLALIELIKRSFPLIPVIVAENTQAVTSYSLRNIAEELLDKGADFIITGEPEERAFRLIELLKNNSPIEDIVAIDGIAFKDKGALIYRPPEKNVENLDDLPFPAWDLFPLKNYWKLGYSHGPFETKRYIPLLTSRGCPYRCGFCVAPQMNNSSWRKRSAKNVLDEMEHWYNLYNAREFHIEDLNPTVDENRILELCEGIINRKLKIVWKIAAGTKAETIKDQGTLALMKKAGCSYISLSQESASQPLLAKMNKSVDSDHLMRLVRQMHQLGIYSQVCFVLGFPGETDDERRMSAGMVRSLARAGVDEIALFIITPVPGSAIYNQFSGFDDYSQLNFSPKWRSDYTYLNHFRIGLYRKFLIWKMMFHPFKIMQQPFRFLTHKFKTKMEMTPWRALHTLLLSLRAKEESSNEN